MTIYSSGTDLLSLINDILDLAKIESGTMPIDLTAVSPHDLKSSVELGFGQIAQARGIEFSVDLEEDLPATVMTDGKRLQQILRNLLSNAFKFTERGRVDLRIQVAQDGWSFDHPILSNADTVPRLLRDRHRDGISPDVAMGHSSRPSNRPTGTTSRRYGGTGLGLSISREIANLLGGEITLQSVPGEGSTFHAVIPRLIYVGNLARSTVGPSIPRCWPNSALSIPIHPSSSCRTKCTTIEPRNNPATGSSSSSRTTPVLTGFFSIWDRTAWTRTPGAHCVGT